MKANAISGSEDKNYTMRCSVKLCLISDCNNSSWVWFNGHCYRFNGDPTSWSEARSRCHLQREDADLALVETQHEQNFINGMLGLCYFNGY